MVRLYLFGAPRMERDGVPLTTDTRKALALLAYLAVTQRAHTRDTLAALLWGDADEQHARGALRRTLFAIRTAAGDDAIEIAADMLAVGRAVWCDVAAFRAGEKPRPAEAAALATAPFMSGFNLRDAPDFEEWQFLEAEALSRELAEVLTRLATGLAAAGDYAGSAAYARRLLALDSLNEEAHRLLMRLYSYGGEQGAALRQYRECVRILDQELGVPPLSETTELYQAIRENRVLRPPERFEAPPFAVAAGSDERLRSPRPRSFAGRAKEWSTLVRLYEQEAGKGCCVALVGEAGIGKTRLAEEFMAYARTRGARVAVGRCYEGEAALAYGVVIDVLRRLVAAADCADPLASLSPLARAEAARLLPELAPAAPPPTPASDPGAGARFLEGLSQFLTSLCPRASPAVLVFDDLHWADEASIDFLTYFARRLSGRPVLVILSWRSDGSPQAERLRLLLAELARTGSGSLLALRRLTLADVVEMAGEIERKDVAERVFRESEGVPLFVAAYLEAIAGSDENPPGLPSSIRDLLSARLAPIADAERQLLQAAAVLGRSFDLDVLQATSGRSSEETLAGVERLVARGLVRETSAQRAGATYDFDHEKLRELTYEATGSGRRRLLHERAGRAWLALGARRHSGEPGAAWAAHHLALAGRDEEAAEQHVVAARQAERVYANAEAIAHYGSALVLGHADPGALREAIADLEALRGNYASALAAYEAAAAHLPGASQTGRLEHKLANLRARLGDWAAADSYYRAAEEALSGALDATKAALYSDWALAAHHSGDERRAAELIEHALIHAGASEDDRAVSQAHNILGVLQRRQGHLPDAIRSLEAVCASAEKLGDAGAHTAALNNLALAVAQGGDIDRGVALLRTALEVATRRGDRHREAALRNNLADLLHAQEREEESMAELKLAVALFAEIGAQAGEPRAEIWNLTEW